MRLLDRLLERRAWYLVSAAVLVVDQATKLAADLWLRGRGAVEVIPGFFSLWYSRNKGGLFGFFSDWSDPLRALLLTLLPLLAIALIGIFLATTRDEPKSSLAGLSLILGGAAGNLLDRLFRGEVVDFLDVYASWTPLASWLTERFGTPHWPTFNVADSAIVVGAGLLLLEVFRPHRSETPSGGGAVREE
jgi:signal peptidase II